MVVHPYYPKAFFDLSWDNSRMFAEIVLPILRKLIGPIRSVCDVGCGNGAMLEVARRQGIEFIAGFDGEWARQALVIPERYFTACDLNEPAPPPTQRFDLCISVEVAEHLEPESAEHLVERLTGLSDVVMFSAAIPGQGGTQHINEQWTAYWVKQFERRGYVGADVIRPRIWEDTRISTWYRQNVLLFHAPDSGLYFGD
jgi:SAM-dependent methyltransferase